MYTRVFSAPTVLMESLTNSLNFPKISKEELSLLTFVANEDSFAFNKVSNKGESRARFKVPNRIDSKVAITYGIANFSIGLAKDNNLKYVFI